MSLSASNASGINKRNIAQVSGALLGCSKVMPAAVKTAAAKTAMTVKPVWYGIMASQANTQATSKVAGRPWRINDSVQGGSIGQASLIVSMDGPMWLVIRPTKPHPIIGRKLGTRKQRNELAQSGALGRGGVKIGKQQTAMVRTRAKFSDVNIAGFKIGKIQTKAAGEKVRAGKLAIYFPGAAGPRAYAQLPGTKGHPGAWEEMKRVGAEIGPKTFVAEGRKALAVEFGKAGKSLAGVVT